MMKFRRVVACILGLLLCLQPFSNVIAKNAPSEAGIAATGGIQYQGWESAVFTINTSANIASPDSLGSDGSVALKSGNYMRWIDRIDVPDYAIDFYETLADEGFWTNEETFSEDSPVKKAYGVNAIVVEAEIPEKEYETANNAATKYLTAAYNAFIRDYPGVFWTENQFMFMSTSPVRYTTENGVVYRQTMLFVLKAYSAMYNYFDIRKEAYRAPGAIAEAVAERDALADTILSGLNPADSAYEKARYLNNWLTTHNEYNTVVAGVEGGTAADSAWECISALSGRTGTEGPVCEGYSKAFKFLCDKIGIPCVLVDGTAGGGAHMWNYIALDGAWYAVDVTWNDPVVYGYRGAVSGFEGESYFAVGADTIISGESFVESHSMSNKVSSSGPSFTNGPVLSLEKYDPNAAPKIMYGDVNGDGDITGKDLVLLRQYLANYNDSEDSSTVIVYVGADANGDGMINGKDLVLLRQYLANYNDETGSSSVVLGPKM